MYSSLEAFYAETPIYILKDASLATAGLKTLGTSTFGVAQVKSKKRSEIDEAGRFLKTSVQTPTFFAIVCDRSMR